MTRTSSGSFLPSLCTLSGLLVVAGLLLATALGADAHELADAAVRIEDYAEPLRGHRVLHLVEKGDKPATMPLTVPVPPGP